MHVEPQIDYYWVFKSGQKVKKMSDAGIVCQAVASVVGDA